MIAVVAALSGCSLDVLVWGPDGARVIETTESVIAAAKAGDTEHLACSGTTPDFGEPRDWAARGAGEPEHFHADYWPEMAPLDPQWSINLESLSEPRPAGAMRPGDVFYRETSDGLCVAAVAWWMAR
jgi:hypothetical protein